MDKEIKTESLTDEELDSIAGGSDKPANFRCNDCGNEFYDMGSPPIFIPKPFFQCPKCGSGNLTKIR